MFYPVAILRYFQQALQRRDDVNVYSVGPWTGTWIPWMGGLYLQDKYSRPPDSQCLRRFVVRLE